MYTADRATPWAEAIACAEGRIIDMGGTREIERHVGPGTRVLDAKGHLVLPGFIDAHVHLIWGYELGSWLDLSDRPSLPEVQTRVAAYAEAHPEEEILVGHGFDYAALQRDGIPGKEALDAAVSDRPVILTAWDGHTGWGNTLFTERALAVIASVGHDVGGIQRDSQTEAPTGLFLHTFDLTQLLPEIQRRRSLDGLRRMLRTASKLGITAACDIQVGLADLSAYVDLWKADELPVRIRVALYHSEGTPRERYADFVAARDRFQDPWLQVAAVKLYIDGVQETGTAALLKPYANNPASRGSTIYSVVRFREIVAEFDRLGFQICTHACGDRGVRIALDTYEEIARRSGPSGRRHRIEHCENLAPEDVPRFARLGVVPCMMPRHAAPELGGRWREAVGPERTQIAFPWRALFDSGAALAFASDWPVADLNPLVGIHEAVARRTADGDPSPHRITVAEAIDAYTRRAAYACHMESSRGTLVPGKDADFIVLSEDLFQIPPGRIPEARVIRTVVAGRIVYEDGTPLP